MARPVARTSECLVCGSGVFDGSRCDRCGWSRGRTRDGRGDLPLETAKRVVKERGPNDLARLLKADDAERAWYLAVLNEDHDHPLPCPACGRCEPSPNPFCCGYCYWERCLEDELWPDDEPEAGPNAIGLSRFRRVVAGFGGDAGKLVMTGRVLSEEESRMLPTREIRLRSAEAVRSLSPEQIRERAKDLI
jgi:hypothetical protein